MGRGYLLAARIDSGSFVLRGDLFQLSTQMTSGQMTKEEIVTAIGGEGDLVPATLEIQAWNQGAVNWAGSDQ